MLRDRCFRLTPRYSEILKSPAIKAQLRTRRGTQLHGIFFFFFFAGDAPGCKLGTRISSCRRNGAAINLRGYHLPIQFPGIPKFDRQGEPADSSRQNDRVAKTAKMLGSRDLIRRRFILYACRSVELIIQPFVTAVPRANFRKLIPTTCS